MKTAFKLKGTERVGHIERKTEPSGQRSGCRVKDHIRSLPKVSSSCNNNHRTACICEQSSLCRLPRIVLRAGLYGRFCLFYSDELRTPSCHSQYGDCRDTHCGLAGIQTGAGILSSGPGRVWLTCLSLSCQCVYERPATALLGAIA